MDNFDQIQIEQEKNIGGYNPNVAIKAAQRIQSNTRTFAESKATPEQVADEMLYAMMNCSPCVRKEK